MKFYIILFALVISSCNSKKTINNVTEADNNELKQMVIKDQEIRHKDIDFEIVLQRFLFGDHTNLNTNLIIKDFQ